MAIPAGPIRLIFNNPGSTVFPFGYLFYDPTELVVSLFNTISTNRTVLVLNTDYSVSGAGNPGGGNITLNGPLAGTYYLIVERIMPLQQGSTYIPTTAIDTDQFNRDLDELVMITQQQQDSLNRTLTAPIDEPVNNVLTLPSSLLRANCFLAFDANGLPVAGTGIGTYRNNWLTATLYNARDLVRDGATGNVYWATQQFTSGANISADIALGYLTLLFLVTSTGNTVYGTWAGNFGGTSSDLTATVTPAPLAMAVNLRVVGVFSGFNTGPTTLNLNGLGAKAITYSSGAAFSGNELVTTGIYEFIYNGTSWVCIGLLGTMVTGKTTIVVLNSGTTWTAPLGVYEAKITLIGAGGGGGPANGTGGGSGGGGGETGVFYTSIIAGRNYTYAIGAGGAGGTGSSSGTAGGSTSWTTPTSVVITALGGAGGLVGPTNPGGAGGTGGVHAPIYFPGEQGGRSYAATTTASGDGGGSRFGFGARGVIAGAGIPILATSTTNFGAGASGGQGTGNNGGVGQNGAIIIEY